MMRPTAMLARIAKMILNLGPSKPTVTFSLVRKEARPFRPRFQHTARARARRGRRQCAMVKR